VRPRGFRLAGERQAAALVKFPPSRTKQKPRKKALVFLGFAWFYSSESGLFNGLRRFQMKKFCWPQVTVAIVLATRDLSCRLEEHSTDSDFRQEMF
jgi:hypothetical protein